MINVTLLAHTPDPLRVIYTAAKACYSGGKPETIFKTAATRQTMEHVIRKVVERGHHSVLEHVNFTFAISGISRACSHQLVRHRVASYSQQSQRYVEPSAEFVVPRTIRKHHKANDMFYKTLEHCMTAYKEMLTLGIPKEDARFVLPNATPTNIVVTMNLRELIHVAGLRLCARAQWEIKFVLALIKKEVKKVDKFLGELLVPRCVSLGYCPEEVSCGLRPKKG